jgi:hypothetical protein
MFDRMEGSLQLLVIIGPAFVAALAAAIVLIRRRR